MKFLGQALTNYSGKTTKREIYCENTMLAMEIIRLEKSGKNTNNLKFIKYCMLKRKKL